MKSAIFSYNESDGWSVKNFPVLDSGQTIVILFAAPQYQFKQGPISQLLAAYPKSMAIGCSTGGEIFGPDVQDASIVVAVIRFESSQLALAYQDISDIENSFQVGMEIASKLLQPNLRGIFVLSEGLNVNGSRLIQGFNSKLPENILVTGGLAGDGDHFQQTWVIANGKLRTNTVVAVGFYGDKIQLGHGSQGGWDSFGNERYITKSNGNILYELDGRPALDLYREYLGELATGLPATGLLFPLAIRKNSHDKKEIVRTILGMDEATKSLRFAGDVPEGYLARLMRGNFDRLVTGANNAAIAAGSNQQGVDSLVALAISCIGRRLLLGEYIEEETEVTFETFPKGTQQIGFYSYGEISPYATGHCDLHNQTMTITTISEKN
jgi:hypothetical protein